MTPQDIAIVVPVYKSKLRDAEVNSLIQCKEVLSRYTIIVVHPASMNTFVYKNIMPHARFETFDEQYFGSISGYNKLLISEVFYKRFEKYQYILIYQLDAWVFSDQLLNWCEKGYDYIGAPWIEKPQITKKPFIYDFTKLCLNKVGNGGVSLRRVATHLSITRRLRFIASRFKYNEDFFWCLLVPWLIWTYKRPDWYEALFFCFELNPRKSLEITNGILPFACHAWEKHDLNFWREYIKTEVKK